MVHQVRRAESDVAPAPNTVANRSTTDPSVDGLLAVGVRKLALIRLPMRAQATQFAIIRCGLLGEQGPRRSVPLRPPVRSKTT